MDAITFLDRAGRASLQPVYAIYGEEDFLKRRARLLLQDKVLGDADPTYALSSYPGDKAEFAEIRGELETIPFLCDRRLVLIELADTFVTNYREALERYVAAPAKNSVLILDLRTFTSTTRLAKAMPDEAKIECKPLTAAKLPGWCIEWAAKQYGKKLSKPTASHLVELTGSSLGMLDGELNKLSVYVGNRTTIDSKDVDQLVGRSRAANVFRILDAVGEGKADEALSVLAELFEEGEEPLAMVGAIGYQLRRLATVARRYKLGSGLDDAFDQAGVASWPQMRESMRKQLRHFGGQRLDKLFDWLLELDLGMKGSSPLPPRLLLERLIVRLARPRAG